MVVLSTSDSLSDKAQLANRQLPPQQNPPPGAARLRLTIKAYQVGLKYEFSDLHSANAETPAMWRCTTGGSLQILRAAFRVDTWGYFKMLATEIWGLNFKRVLPF